MDIQDESPGPNSPIDGSPDEDPAARKRTACCTTAQDTAAQVAKAREIIASTQPIHSALHSSEIVGAGAR